MKNVAAAAAAVGSLLTGPVRGAQGVEGVVSWDIERRQHTQLPSRIRRRNGDVQATLTNDLSLGGYFVNCEVGTPAQAVTLQLDTGSSDVWVPASSAPICKSDGCSLGSFTSADSSTFNITGKGQFNITYVDDTSSQGDYFTDSFTLAGASLSNMTMGLGLTTSIAYGLVGIGYELNEAIVGQTSSASSAYDNLPIKMCDEGLIKSVAYSLWLNDLDASKGNILFGGIDTAKYQGDLTRIKIYQTASGSREYFTSFIVALTSLTAVSASGNDTLTSTEFPIAVVLDSGTTLSYLPDDIVAEIWTEVGAAFDNGYGLGVLPCNMAASTGRFAFGFAGPGGPVVSVGMDELVVSISDPAPTFASGKHKGQDACSFGIQKLGPSATYLLGDTFLRSAYVVYDLVNNEIGIAATDFNATGSNIVAFTSSGQPIPSATEAPNQADVTVSTPAYTTPAYSARSGFMASSASSARSGGGAVAGITMMMMMMAMLGAALFASWI